MSIVRVVDVMPRDHSDDISQNSEPSIAVNPANIAEIVITAFTSPDSGVADAPIYRSNDGGASWFLNFDVPGGFPGDQSIGFATGGNEFYVAILRGDVSQRLNALRTADPSAPGELAPAFDVRNTIDQPWVEARTVVGGPDDGKDRLYIGYNNDAVGTGHASATIDVCLDARAVAPTFTPVVLDPRPVGAGLLDGYATRPVCHADGTVYAIYEGWRSGAFLANITTDIVVVRDDAWGSGASPFTALTDPGDLLSGYRVATGVVINDGGFLGQERLNNDLGIAVDPTNSSTVYIVWCDNAGPNYTLRVRRSLTRGTAWSGDLLTVDNATMASIAINSVGVVGLMYQQVNAGNWETHFRRTTDATGTVWDDVILSQAPATVPGATFQPYLGDWARIVAVGKAFYGTFCANNTPDPANFPATPASASAPNGATFLRNVSSAAPWQILGNDGATVKAVSIDPFFFYVTDVDAASDFYVRDWTDSAASGDDGAQPSTHGNFHITSDVWNQHASNVAEAPNAADQLVGEDAGAGAGALGDNYLFARIRRNTLPSAGSVPADVIAHFLVSEFGTGSNFVDWSFADPGDPDITFPVRADVTVSFADTELGPKITPPFQWHLGPTASTHLCIAVEIIAPGDPLIPPGLTGRAPGWPTTDTAVVNDNNKAQRNISAFVAHAGGHASTYYGIAHNAATKARDMVLEVAGSRDQRVPEGAVVEVITAKGAVERQPWRPWSQIVLRDMEPGENRWIGITIPVPNGAGSPVAVTINELNGSTRVNGFTIAATPAPADVASKANAEFHRAVFTRMAQAFGIDAGGEYDRGAERREDADRDAVEKRFSVEEGEVTVDVTVRIERRDKEDDKEEDEHERSRLRRGAAHWLAWLTGRAHTVRAAVTELLDKSGSADAFGVLDTLARLEHARDEATELAEHATLLHKLDAFMTMLQKAHGDPADILQNVIWQIDLHTGSTRLSALPDAAEIVDWSRDFVERVASRRAGAKEYAALLTALVPALGRSADALAGSGTGLRALVDRIEAAKSTRARQKAHREFLLRLQTVA